MLRDEFWVCIKCLMSSVIETIDYLEVIASFLFYDDLLSMMCVSKRTYDICPFVFEVMLRDDSKKLMSVLLKGKGVNTYPFKLRYNFIFPLVKMVDRDGQEIKQNGTYFSFRGEARDLENKRISFYLVIHCYGHYDLRVGSSDKVFRSLAKRCNMLEFKPKEWM